MKVFIVVQKGVYRHNVIGVFNDVDTAIAAGHASADSEYDHYHDAEIISCEIGGSDSEEYIGRVKALWIDRRFPNRGTYTGTVWEPGI